MMNIEDSTMNKLMLSGISSTQQRPSLGRFAALINDSIEDTDQDDFLPTTQNRISQINTKPTKRKLPSVTPTTTSINSVEKKRSKKSNLFHDVVSASSSKLNNHSTSPPPPWLDLPMGISLDFLLQFSQWIV